MKRAFKTEVQQLLNIIVHSLYSNRDIFLRELISNASDAIDKLRFKSQTEPDALGDDPEFKIRLIPDKDNNTLTVSDNGIGMTEEEVVENIGTIAKSGTMEFLKALESAGGNESLTQELIGRFGVGFYSAFIVADKVTLVTRAAGADSAIRWESTGDGEYVIEPAEKATRGTEVTLHLKKGDADEADYTDTHVLRAIVREHSDFVSYPVVMDVEKKVPVETDDATDDAETKMETKVEEETLNSMKAIWARDKSGVTEDEYKEFYKHVSHDWNDPLTHLHVKLEGVTEFTALLYIPEKSPFMAFDPEKKHGVKLYSRRVFIMDDCRELVPEYLRFVKGVVDAPDLNLNISREILQQDRIVRAIRKNLVKKLLKLIGDLDEEKFTTFWKNFGAVLKEGVYTDWENKDALSELLRFYTTDSMETPVSLKTYVSRMKPDQKEIYYITGENIETLADSPLLEKLREKSYEILLMNDPVDEFVVQTLTEYDKKPLKSVEKGDLDIEPEEKEKTEAFSGLMEHMQKALEDSVKQVRPSGRLTRSVACLAGESDDMSAYMQKLLKASGHEAPKSKRVLELNLDHPAVKKVQDRFAADENDPTLAESYALIFDLAVVAEGGKPDDPARFAQRVGDLMAGPDAQAADS